jgi:hypothetical protein
VSAPPTPFETPSLRPLARFGTVLSWGLRRTFRSRRFAVTAVVALVVGGGLGAVAGRERDAVHALWELLGGGLLGVAVPLVALALVGGGFGEEVADQTLVYHLVRPVSRRTVFLARYVAGLLPALVVAAAMTVAAAVASGVGLPPSVLTASAVVAALGVTTVGALYYSLAALFRRGLVAGLVYTFVVEGFLQFLPGTTQKLSLMHHVTSVFHRWVDDDFAARSRQVARAVREAAEAPPLTDMLVPALREEWTTVSSALVVCAVVVAVALALAGRAVARKDFPLKE